MIQNMLEGKIINYFQHSSFQNDQKYFQFGKAFLIYTNILSCMPLPNQYLIFWNVLLKIILTICGVKNQWVKNPPAMQRHRRCRLGAWIGKIPWRMKWQPRKIPWPEETGGLSPWGCKELGMTKHVKKCFVFYILYIGNIFAIY